MMTYEHVYMYLVIFILKKKNKFIPVLVCRYVRYAEQFIRKRENNEKFPSSGKGWKKLRSKVICRIEHTPFRKSQSINDCFCGDNVFVPCEKVVVFIFKYFALNKGFFIYFFSLDYFMIKYNRL